ncbi:MAG: AmmeMemoRadiSam system radical SAM enzyme [Theionarchaea archaeon]|nr:AmmeMemoRadiSam system radical SAM enzyme [Theionarchaea archaeon]MBU7000632.1 AmmeMemoRadiSam system radical SAM enzyme [Theionarchaea archaeon]MBU7021985.1 AmmeMemoRadiSam system radical SAM enzyme [Theionarchaea archaeon]MBU7035773.1 AmmeMemoRadiSam system radical SAM enzyme [Theionarchaea archaeon]MBU7041363.1 AmmeMemoRadiSam system radical SAM enzyme [Theionarchaea archaeon]
MKEARFYETLPNEAVQCHLCPHECVIRDGKRGVCGIRENQKGILYSTIYEEITSRGVDPVEKKPLYHFYPGSEAYSVGTLGCNLSCSFCQNWEISQGSVPTYRMTSHEIVEATEYRKCMSIAYTYNEPSVWYEFVYDTAALAREHGINNVLVTNGYINEEPLKELLPFIDAMNIDVKAFTDSFYKELCHGKLDPVLKTAEMAKKSTWVEITTLIIPGKNDSDREIEELVSWVASSLGEDTPLHFSRYYPSYHLHIPPTDIETLERARSLALKELRYCYIGNVWNHEGDNTYCYNCGNTLITRRGFSASIVGITEERTCCNCGARIDIVL